jgi:uncharacterized protein YndB with AHSA1/START domain
MPPRRTIAAIDEVILPHPPADVRRMVGDLAHYQEWWGPPYRFETVTNQGGGPGTSVRMSNGSFLLWTATVTEADADRVLLTLDKGAWVGEARWAVSPCQEGTRLIFRIDVDPRPFWLRLLSRSMDFKRRHSMAMLKVFTRLRERMDADQRANALTPDTSRSISSTVV